jgi:hypothetical protein
MSRSLFRFCLSALIAVLLPAVSQAQVPTPSDYQAQLDCNSPSNQKLFNAPMHPDPRDNVWLLVVLGAMGLGRHCQELDENMFAKYLERQAANDILQEPIGQPATVREALEWERRTWSEHLQLGVSRDREQIHNRMLTRAFALEPWAPKAADVDMLRKMPNLAMMAPGLWVDATQSIPHASAFRLTLSFVNRTARSIDWDAHYLVARSAAKSKYDLSFDCVRDGREGPKFTINRATVAPGERVNILCLLSNQGFALSAFDAAWLDQLRSGPEQWVFEGPLSNGGTYDYQETIRRYASDRSHAAAAPYLRMLTCNQSVDCINLKVAWWQSPMYQWLSQAGPALLMSIALTWLLSSGRRARMGRIAIRLAKTTVVLFVAAIALLIFFNQSLGMATVALALIAWRATVGAVLGLWALRVWAGKPKAEERADAVVG